jgi:hypothetical protein
MSSKKPASNKPEKTAKNNRQSRQLSIYRTIFVIISLIILFSMLFSAVATF